MSDTKSQVNKFFELVEGALDFAHTTAFDTLDNVFVEVDKYVDTWHKNANALLDDAGLAPTEPIKEDAREATPEEMREQVIKFFADRGLDNLAERARNGTLGSDDIRNAYKATTDGL